MDRVVYLDPSLESFFGRQQSERRSQVELCIGTYDTQIEVLDCIPAPEDEETAGGPNSSSDVDALTQSLMDYGFYLNKALPGGISVVGVYVTATASEITAFHSPLKRALKKICDSGNTSDGVEDRVILEMQQGSATPSAALINASKGSTAEEKCKVQFRSAGSLVPIYCRYSLEVSLPFAEEAPSWKAIRKQLLAVISTSLQNATAVLNGKELVQDQKISDCEGDRIEILFCSTLGSRAEIGDHPVKSYLTVQGVLDCRAMCHSADPLQSATERLKGDVLSTLRSRFQLMEELTEEAEEKLAPFQSLPRRVWGNWKSGIPLCDYPTAEETTEDAVRNLHDLVHTTLTQMEDNEKPPHVRHPRKDWDPFQVQQGSLKRSKGGQFLYAYGIAVLVALLAILVGYWLYRGQPLTQSDEPNLQ